MRHFFKYGLAGISAHARLPILLLFLSFALPVHARQNGIDLEGCRTALDKLVRSEAQKHIDYSKLDAEQKSFLDDVWLPTLGLRSLFKNHDELRTCSLKNKNCVVFGNFGEGMDIELRWEKLGKGAEPRVEVQPHDGSKVLVIPRGFEWSKAPEGGSHILRQFLAGHDLHPYDGNPRARAERDALGESKILKKQVQLDAERAVSEAVDNGDSSFLFVAPTGVGKTEVLKALLTKRINQTKEQIKRFLSGKTAPGETEPGKVHVVILPDTGLRTQTLKDIKKMQEELGFELLTWGDGDGYLTVDQLSAKAKSSDKPIVVVTTADSFLLSVKKNVEITGDKELDVAQAEETENLIRKHAATLIFDEAHHAGAPEMRDLLPRLVDRSKGSRAFLYGTTATPAHSNVDLIKHVFKNRAFWAYLDTPDGYRSGVSSVDRNIPEILEQLGEAILRGDSANFSPVPLDPNRFRDMTGVELFKETRPREDGEKENGLIGNRWVIDPRHYKNVAQRTLPYFLRHKRGFVTAASKEEAQKMAAEFQALLDDYVLNPKKYKEMPRFLAEMSPEQRDQFIADLKETKANEGNRDRRLATVAYLHSGLSAKEKDAIKEDFENGRIQFLVTVRMLDEGINVPDMSLWLDLNRGGNPKQQLQRLGRILRLATGKDWKRPSGKNEVEWVSFQEPQDIEMAQMLLDLYSISEGRQLSQGRHMPNKESEATPLTADENEPIADVQWSEAELRSRYNYLFFQDSGRGEKTAAQDAKRIVDHINSGATLDVFATDDKSTRLTYDKLSSRIDASDSQPGKKKFNAIIESYPHARDEILKLQNHRAATRESLKTGDGAAVFLKGFYEKYGRLPQTSFKKPGTTVENERSKDEKEIHDQIEKYVHHGDLDFLLEATGALPESVLRALKVPQKIEEILADRARVVQLGEKFLKDHDGQLPSAEAKGFEGQLARTLLEIDSPLDSVGDKPVAWALAAVHEQRAAKERHEREAAQQAAAELAAKQAALTVGPPVVKYVPKFAPHHAPVEASVRTGLAKDVANMKSQLDSRDYVGKQRLDELEKLLKTYEQELVDLAEAEKQGDGELIDLYREAAAKNAETLFSTSSLRQILDGSLPASQLHQAEIVVSGHTEGVRHLADFYKEAVQSLNRELKSKSGGRPMLNSELWSIEMKEVEDARRHQKRVALTIKSPKGETVSARDIFSREHRTVHTASFSEGNKVQTADISVTLKDADGSTLAGSDFSRRYNFERDSKFVDQRLSGNGNGNGSGDESVERRTKKRFSASDLRDAVRLGLLEELKAKYGPTP